MNLIELNIESQSNSQINLKINSVDFEIVTNLVNIVLNTANGAAIVPLTFDIKDDSITNKLSNEAITNWPKIQYLLVINLLTQR